MGEIEDLLAQMKAEYQKRDQEKPIPSPSSRQEKGLFWFLCGNEVYTDTFFRKIALKVLPDKHFTIP
ncbi:MAG: hypothetical protein IM504_22980 [Microcystis sp. M038S2]|uniref:hypothetical protein n=1 Tax=unclassified Microcystis TaxID=2643300 RepID=UPI0025886ECD|nr:MULTISPECIES: hypothetical protein [unclassified Microcystis]MCA2684968.1 hypothetical protein [Microcystis sp. M046S2]MCA2707549.1 hypothetical protein [Microcystis sp. M038S2]MCA2946934.1 hypothetical protein [Microcystis sp. M109S1]MCA2951323.1 hypothetical protein [Microcystis sp. M112S1]